MKTSADAKPRPQCGSTLLPPDDVTAHPLGASPYGVLDLVGNVWQWTDEYLGEHVRVGVLKGGSSYFPRTTIPAYYFPQPQDLTVYGRYLLVSPSSDRSGTIGFRCVVKKRI
jgi:iron(II)-dependent oxidoreductase